MKKLLLSSLIICFHLYGKSQISQGLFGQNAQLTQQVGTNTSAGGQLDNFWNKSGTNASQNWIGESNTRFMRYSGSQVENDCNIDGDPAVSTDPISITILDYINKAKKMQENGIEPMLALPLKYGGLNPIATLAAAATQAGKLVTGVNNALLAAGSPYKPVVFWIYANEPDLPTAQSGNHGYDGMDAPQKIHDYIQAYHGAVISIWNNSWNNPTYPGGPQFVGPELISFDNYLHPSGLDKLIKQLCGQYNQSGLGGGAIDAWDIRPFISVFTWHFYPFNDQSVVPADPYIPLPFRQNIIEALSMGAVRQAAAGGRTQTLAQNVADITPWLAGFPNIKLGITEANICHINDVNTTTDPSGTNSTPGSDDLLTGNGANSFIAGQFWAEMMCICMKENISHLDFWSSLEGFGGTNFRTNVGFLNSDPSKFGGAVGAKKPTFYHFKMLADNFKGTFFTPTISPSNTDIKAFAAQGTDRIAVLIMNQSTTLDNTFTVKINGTASGSDINISFSGMAGITGSPSYVADDLDANHLKIENQSTVLLIFDCQGNISSRYDYKLSGVSAAPGTYQGTTISTPFDNALVGGNVSFVHTPSQLTAPACGTFNMSPDDTDGFSYAWNPPPAAGTSSNAGSQVDLCAYVTGGTATYIYTVTDDEGCSTSSGIDITDGGIITAPGPYVQPRVCNLVPATCNLANGQASICGSLGSSPSYLWDNGETTNTAIHLTPGVHNVTISGQHFQVLIPNNNTPTTVNAGIDKTTCQANSTLLNGSAYGGPSPYTYSWAPSTGLSATNITNPLANPAVTTTYTLTVTDANGCQSKDQVTITKAVPPTLYAGHDMEICQGNSKVVQGLIISYDPSQIYNWTPALGLNQTNVLVPIANPITTTVYKLTVTDANGCSVEDNVTVTVNPPVVVSISASPSTICEGLPTSLNGNATGGTGTLTYMWTPATVAYSNQTASNTNAYPTSNTNFVLTVVDSKGCVSTANQLVTVNPAVIVSPTASSSSICQGSSTTLFANASGGTGTLSYLWLPVSGVAYSASRFVPSPIVTPSSSTNFTVRVTDSQGCTAVGSKLVTVNNYQSAFSYPMGNYCASAASTVLPAMGQFTSLAGAFSSSPTGLNFVSNTTGEINLGTSSPGIYTITYSVPAANGCPGSVTNANVTINANDPSVIANAGPDKTVGRNCSATLTAGNYNFLNNYFWYKKGDPTPINSANAPSVVVYPASTTTYVLKVVKGCASFDEVTVNVNPSIRCFTKWNPVLFEVACASRGSNGPKEYSGVLNSDLLIADDTIWVTGNLKVTNNKRLDFSNSYIIITAGAKIEVQPGSKLNIDRSVLQTCDGSMWKGIEVMSNYNDPTQLSINNSLITNAETAVKTDKATDIKISGSLFMNGNIGINLDRNKGFNITESEFNNYDIGIKTTKTLPGTSVIARNTFRSVRTAVSFDGDDHSKLIISCNSFDYRDYAIKSDNTMLKNQGTLAEGAGNDFITTSTLPTNKLRHSNGNNMTYYYDPSNPVAAGDMSTIIYASMDNSKCELITSRMMQSSNPEIVEGQLNFKLYPNPNNGSMKFDYQLSDDQNGTIVICDVSGRKISQYLLEHSKTTIGIDDDSLQNGLYFYEVIVNDKVVSTNKIIIIK